MQPSQRPIEGRSTPIAVSLLVAASAALTLGFACALPLAAFGTFSAVAFRRGAATVAVFSVWLVNQIIGFAFMGYPLDASTLAWGAALGGVGLLSLGAAGMALARLRGAFAIVASFLVAFVAYQGSIYLACLASGTDVTHFTAAVVGRVFLINAASLGALVAVRALWSGAAGALGWVGVDAPRRA